MSIDLQIREQLALYVLDRIDAAALESWLAEATWDIDDEPSLVRHLAFEAFRLVSETANGDWSEEELRRKLVALLQTVSPALTSTSWSGEGFLEKLAAAEEQARERGKEEIPVEALIGYASFASSTVAAFGSLQSNDRGFLHQPEAESSTQHLAPAELAAG